MYISGHSHLKYTSPYPLMRTTGTLLSVSTQNKKSQKKITSNSITIKSSVSGFTLIEILIVLLIIGIIATFSTLAVSDWGESRRSTELAQAIGLMIPAAQQEAILQPSELAMAISEDGIAFFTQYYNSRKQRKEWRAMTRNTGLSFYEIPSDIRLELIINNKIITTDNARAKTQPQILFSSSGNMTPFTLFIGPEGAPPQFRIIGTFNGAIKQQRLEPDTTSGAIQ